MNTRLSPDQDRLQLEREARARDKEDRLGDARPLSHYRDVRAWVLLADPGAGKSDVFTALALSEGGTCVSARDFVEVGAPADWQEPLFIDGLDEISAGISVGMTPLGLIRQKLQQLGPPKFRISCREADWRGNADGEALKRLVGNDNFTELHLAPLTHWQSVALVAHWQLCTEAQAEAFMQEAQRRDLEGLLDNPQTLRLLVKAHAVNGDKWPTSKTQTYELACAQLVREHNDEHLANTRDSTPPDDQTLLAAGYLCAVMLLSGSQAIALQRQNQPRAGVVTLPELNSTASVRDLSTCRSALHTRLFRGNGTGDFWAVHRTVAEYLGAHYLASRINAGLPASRVLALMLGEDGGMVPELRGLHAWLAAVAPADLRRELIAHDPLGVVINGDVRAFHHTDKLALLDALRHEANQDASFRRGNWASHPFGALATTDMEADFKALLQSPERSPMHQALLGCVLDALTHGQSMPALTQVLELVVRDKSYKTDVRTQALRVLVREASHNANWPLLTQLLTDIHSNTVEDSEDELLGTLLQALYPNHLSPAELWKHFRKPRADGHWGAYKEFWHEFTQPQTNAPALLDALSASGFQIENNPDDFDSRESVGNLLVSGVTQHGHQVEIHRLYAWLSLGLGAHDHCPLMQHHQTKLAQWLSEHPAIYKKLFEHGLELNKAKDGTGFSILWAIRARLYQATEPEEAASWFFALAHTIEQAELRHQLVNESFQQVYRHTGPDAALHLLETWSCEHPQDAAWARAYLQCDYPPTKAQQESNELNTRHKTYVTEEERKRNDFFHQTLPSFENGPAHLGALVKVAESYLSNLQTITKTTQEARLLKLLNQDPEWLRLALHGLRQCLFRDDLPSADDILALAMESRRNNLANPCLAAMALRESEDSATTLDLPVATLETVAAFQLTNLSGGTPSWFKRLLTEQAGVVVKVMVKYIQAQIATKNEHINGPSSLAYNADYATVAQQVTLQLLVDFPAKAYKALLSTLQTLILAAMRNLTQDILLLLIATKLANKTLDVGQHIYWLAAGLQLDSDTYLEPMRRYVGSNQARIHHVFNFYYQQRGERGRGINLAAAAQIFLIGLLGPKSSPDITRPGMYVITAETEIGSYVGNLIHSLANNPDEVSAQALTDFLNRVDMKPWHDSLSRALYNQRIARRKALFKPATVKQVCDTLANLQPASAADLWALTVDHLTHLIRKIRDSDKDIYDLYWDGDKPKSEERCRNALLTALEPRLSPLAISALPERQLADKKRADIGIASGLIHIPLEAKGEWNPDLWKAIEKQLVAQYCREPASDGYGIYLVFWFTGHMKSAPSDGGTKPKTPQELQQRLQATVPEALKHKIAVLVVDCSKPPASKTI